MKTKRSTWQRGFTLVELMGAVVISLIVILMLYRIFDRVQSVFTVSQNRARTMEAGRVAMDMMVKDFQALAPAALTDLTGEIPNIEWAQLSKQDYLSPVRRYYVSAINFDTGVMEVENAMAPAIDDVVYFPDAGGVFGSGKVINSAENSFAYLQFTDGQNPLVRFQNRSGRDEPPLGAVRVEVHMGAIEHARWELYSKLSQELYRQHCRFFTNDEGWRMVDYKFGGRDNYKTMDPASPIGALWVYRSRVVDRSGLKDERQDHFALIAHDPPNRKLDDPVGYSRVIDGVLHFRVRAVSPRDPGRTLASPAMSFYTGGLVPTHVMVELAVADENLVLQMEETIEQQMEDAPSPQMKYWAKMKFLSKNLDRIYFFKQLILIKGESL